MKNLPVKPEQYISIRDWCNNDGNRVAQLSNTIAGSIIQLSLYCGRKIESEDAAVYAGAFTQDLINDFSYLDTLEIRIILNAGVRGKFGEWYGINPLTFYNWTSAYVNSDQRAAYVRRRREIIPPARQLEAKQPPTPEQTWMMVKRWVNEDYQNYCLWREGKWLPEYNGTFGKVAATSNSRPVPPHPLADLGNTKITWLQDEGYTGSLEEIYAAAYAAKKTEL
jgi:hypothetical protein